MAFDIESTLTVMRKTAAELVSDTWPGVLRCIDDALERQKGALERVAAARIRGDISDADMHEHLRGEQVALSAAFRACNVRGNVTSDRIADALVGVLKDAVARALP